MVGNTSRSVGLIVVGAQTVQLDEADAKTAFTNKFTADKT